MGDVRKTTEQFIIEAQTVHGDKYNYSKVEYKTNKDKVCIICPQHGEFWKSPEKHLRGQGCPACVGKKRKTTEDFIKEAQEVHGDVYDYTETEYKAYNTKLRIICKEHGPFEMTPSHHLHGQGCPVCRYIKSASNKRRTLNEVIELASKTHQNKYDYSLITEYKNDRIKYPIICPKHGVFYQNMNNHIFWERACPQCGIEKNAEARTYTTEEFIQKAVERHQNKYDYSKVTYINSQEKVCIICPIHGEFWQSPNNHLYGQGCPICKDSKLAQIISKFLQLNNIEYEEEKTFDWLKYKRNLYLDFYLPQYNVAIECQGKQHFIDEGFGDFELNVTRDKIKKQLCDEHGIKVLYFSNLKIEYPYEVYTDEKKLLEEITSGNLGIKK